MFRMASSLRMSPKITQLVMEYVSLFAGVRTRVFCILLYTNIISERHVRSPLSSRPFREMCADEMPPKAYIDDRLRRCQGESRDMRMKDTIHKRRIRMPRADVG